MRNGENLGKAGSKRMSHLLGLNLVPVLVLGVHRHELEQHQVEDGGDDGEAEEDEEEGEEDVEGLGLQGFVLLEGHQVPEPWPAR